MKFLLKKYTKDNPMDEIRIRIMSLVLEVIQTRGTDYVLDYSYMSTKIEEWIKSGLIPKNEAYKVCQCINSLRN